MNNFSGKIIFAALIILFNHLGVNGQAPYIISGQVTDAAMQPVSNVTIRFTGNKGGFISKADGSFVVASINWYDTLEFTHTGFEPLKLVLRKGHSEKLSLQLKEHVSLLADVVIKFSSMDKEPGKRFMKKVIANKSHNNPDRFTSYSYGQYSRHEVDISNIDSAQKNNKGLKNLTLNIYRSMDSANKNSSILPLYFSEIISNKYHQLSPAVEKENVLAKKKLGLQTDDLLRKLDKFNFSFNIYDDWLPVFNQTYASPLSNTAFDYYNFYFNDSSMVDGKKLYKVHFSPKQKFERAFTGSLWINDSTYSISKIDMRLSKTANLNFVNDIHYIEEYKLSLDSTNQRLEYMPFRYSSKVDFETGLALLGIPVKANDKGLRLVINNTITINHIKFNVAAPDDSAKVIMDAEATAQFEKEDAYWKEHRIDTLSTHEKSIYLMVDSLQRNSTYQKKAKLINTIGMGFYDANNIIRIGPLTSLLSTNVTEGLRSRVGFWTLPGISKKLNVNGYIAYGTKDNQLKAQLGLQYVWDAVRWSKTSLNGSIDYNYLLEKDDELDDDNLLTSLLRKKIPSTNIFVQSIMLKHEQYISKNLSAKASIGYKELLPVFHFTFHPLDKITEKPIDSVNKSQLPVAEGFIGLRFAKGQKTTVFNYGLVRLDNYNPIITVNFTYGIEYGKAQFIYQKINIGIEQRLRLPPKSIFYYKASVGKTYGIAPYLLLDVPTGNETYVDSRYKFNTMLPYEYAADKYLSLHTRLYTGGMLFDNIPYLNRLGLRERYSFNLFMGSMTDANQTYNNTAHFSVTANKPFMETGVGVENIFHLLSVDYFWRLSKSNDVSVHKDGLFLGLKLAF